MEQPNFIALIVAAISTLVVGFIWYNPKVFGSIWMKEVGMTEEKAKQSNMILTFGLSVVLAFIAAFYLYITVMFGGAPEEPHGVAETMNFGHGAFHGAILSLFVVMPALVTNALFEQRSFKYMLVNVGFWVVNFALMGGIINAWPA